jgi:glycosyltransferase involved in cell wall biosynthesis
MRILYIAEIYPDVKRGMGVWGGGEKQFYEISRWMAKRGHEVIVLTCRFPGQTQEDFIDGVRVIRVGLTRDPKTGGARRVILPIFLYALKTMKQAAKLRPDIIHCNTYFPVYPGEMVHWMQGAPLVTTFHDIYGLSGWVDAQRSVVWGLLGHLATVVAAKLPHGRIIAVSPQCKRKLLALGIPEQRITVIPNGIDLQLLDSTHAEKALHQILYVGRLVHFKRVDILIRAFALVLRRIPDARLKIVGGGPQYASLRKLVNALSLDEAVTFTGVTATYETTARYFKESALFALPSVMEGESIAAKEAMAASLPVLAARVPSSGVLALVRDGVSGFLVEPNQPTELAERIIELLENDEKREAMGLEGRHSVETYDWKVIADRTLQAYRETMR